KARGATLELVRKEPGGSGEVYVVLMRPKAGPVVQYNFDTQSNLLLKTVVVVNMPQLGGDIQQTSQYMDYREQDGVKLPFQTRNSSPVQSATITIQKTEHNTALDGAMFAKPGGDRN